MFKVIVIGLDGSEASGRAIHMGCDIASKYESQVHLVHTPQPKTVAFALVAVSGYHAATTMPSVAEVLKACEKIVNDAVAIARQHDVKIQKTYTDQGDPAEQIIACAEMCDADLIITGRRGLGSIKSLIQGSTSLQVNHLASCACLSVV